MKVTRLHVEAAMNKIQSVCKRNIHTLTHLQSSHSGVFMGDPHRDIDDLPKNPANFSALTPLGFLERAALLHPTRNSLIHTSVTFTWAQTYHRCRRLASALLSRSVTFGSTVAVVAPNIPAMFEAHFGVPMSGAVLNTINIRLNAHAIAFLLGHSHSDIIMVDQEFFSLVEEALKIVADKSKDKFKPPTLIVIADTSCDRESLEHAMQRGAIEYETFLDAGDPDFAWRPPQDEWHSIALSYTSGTTSSPKGVVLHHRGAYLMALSNSIVWGIGEEAVYLWTLPMFHCNGWCFPWTLAAICTTSVCLREVTPKAVYAAIANLGVTHFCAAPVVLNAIINASKEDSVLPLPRVVKVMTAGAAPPTSVLSAMQQRGFRVTHTYGLSETYGPSTICAWKPEWDSLPPEAQARMNSRQGVRYVGLEALDMINTQTTQPVPADGKTVGEVVFRGNVVMKGYLKNPKANEEAFANGWYHSGDLAVKHPDNYIEIKDRSKDIIISGGENISSVEVENVLYQHEAILEVSVVARADEQWGESPCAFVALKPGVDGSDQERLAEDIEKFSRSNMPAYWVPKSVVFGELPKTATGKIQKHVLRAKAKELGAVKKSKL
ncbi:acetate--CoA ligase CCL3 [Salvia hispanica]|uniref:acetate--CoA ligase CCL3 n=1 Tax=Salvia hispanica TaxID=49212 RepID=UPI002009C701|nr:acetate--CoA ligase CCL3 [Salvia hispanica]